MTSLDLAPKKPDTSKGFHPQLALTVEILRPAREALRFDGVLEGSVLGPQIHRFLLDWARLRNVYSSSKMEGSPIRLDDAHRVLQAGKAEKPQEEEVLRLSRAYSAIHASRRFDPLTVDAIVSLHGQLFTGLLEEEDAPGRLKTARNGVWDDAIAGYVFEATPPKRTRAELRALLSWYYAEGQLLDPAVSAGLFFAEFQAIHPFLEGNGRLGRLLNQRLLRARGFENVTLTAFDGILFRRGRKYYESLRATNKGSNYHVWLRFYADCLRMAYKEAVTRGDLAPILTSVAGGCERDLLGWVLTSGLEWFRRANYPNAKGYAPVTISEALASLHGRKLLERRGERRAAKYRLDEAFLSAVYARNAASSRATE
ncbi:MAG: Fic family protein [Candidatus Thermoplasmatota archaeon]